jgi:hypothetical protein
MFDTTTWIQVMRHAVAGLMIGIVASLIFSANFRLWNRFDADKRPLPQIICFASYFFNLGIFCLTTFWAIGFMKWGEIDISWYCGVICLFCAAAPFAIAIRTGFIPKRNGESK